MIDCRKLIEDQEIIYKRLDASYEKVNGYDFYRYIFPNNQNEGEYDSHYQNPNAIFLYKPDEEVKNRVLNRRIMLNDTFKNDYMDYIECNEMALCGGLAYRGMANRLENAQQMNALIIDLDSVGYNEFINLYNRLGKSPDMIRSIPNPTFLAMSGTGIHLYYVLDDPVELFPNIKLQLKSLKHDLTFRIWDYKSTTQLETVQYQSINQAFRMIGSINSKYNREVIAFKTGKKISLEELNSYVDERSRVDINKKFRPSKYSREEAKEKFPEWYQRVVVDGIKAPKKWHIKRDLYDWWLRKAEEISGGHRYYYLMCLSIYAYKCDISKKDLEKDMNEIFDKLAEIPHTNPLKKEDMISALEAYDRQYYNFTIDDIVKLTDVEIIKNKRNYQSQADHLEEARMIRDLRMRRQGKKWTDGNGRPSKKDLVEEYIKNNPDKNPTEIARALDISRTTVYKYMKL